MYGRISCLVLLCLTVALLVALAACKMKEEQPPAKQARLSTSKAYEKYFGPAPTTDKGTCYAFVIYFPSAKEPGKVVPFPFFTFDGASMKKVALERLIGGMDVPAYKNEILQPFAVGAHLRDLSQQDGVAKIDLSKDFLRAAEDREGMLNALVLTLSQFDGVKGVKLVSEGKELAFAKGTQHPVVSSVRLPSPPRLLSVTAVKDKGAKEVEEVSAYFDRPVEIKEVRITGRDGKLFEGDVYQSVFDMAAVLKLRDPSLLKAGMPVKVRWKVVDKVGRMAAGDEEYSLEVKEH